MFSYVIKIGLFGLDTFVGIVIQILRYWSHLQLWVMVSEFHLHMFKKNNNHIYLLRIYFVGHHGEAYVINFCNIRYHSN